jgi:hypothetical protein
VKINLGLLAIIWSVRVLRRAGNVPSIVKAAVGSTVGSDN